MSKVKVMSVITGSSKDDPNEALRDCQESARSINLSAEDLKFLNDFGRGLAAIPGRMGIKINPKTVQESLAKLPGAATTAIGKQRVDGKRTPNTEKLMEIMIAVRKITAVVATLQGVAGYANELGRALYIDAMRCAQGGDMSKWERQTAYADGAPGMLEIIKGFLTDELKVIDFLPVPKDFKV